MGFERGQVIEGGAYSDAIIGGGVRVLTVSSAHQAFPEHRLCHVPS